MPGMPPKKSFAATLDGKKTAVRAKLRDRNEDHLSLQVDVIVRT